LTATRINPTLSPLLRLFILLITLILFGGASLLFVPGLIAPHWPWPLAPFNAGFLGAVYLAEFAGSAVLVAANRWAPARLSLAVAFAFAVVVSGVSLLYVPKFDMHRLAGPAWFVLYIGAAIVIGAFLWLYRNLPPADSAPVSAKWRTFLAAQGVVVGLYGIGLLVLPTPFSSFWPWPIDAFHGQVYSSIFITAAVGSFVLYRAAAPIEWLTLGLAEMLFALGAIWGLVSVDLAVHRVNWTLPGVWVWLGAFVLLTIAGAAMILQSRK
jgi:hypothetical protein